MFSSDPFSNILLHIFRVGIGVRKGSFAFWDSLYPFSLVLAAIAEDVGSVSSLLVFTPLPFVAVTVGIFIDSKAVTLFVEEGSFVAIPIWKLDYLASVGKLSPGHISCKTMNNDGVIECKGCRECPSLPALWLGCPCSSAPHRRAALPLPLDALDEYLLVNALVQLANQDLLES